MYIDKYNHMNIGNYIHMQVTERAWYTYNAYMQVGCKNVTKSIILFVDNTLPYYPLMDNTPLLYSRTHSAFFCGFSHKVMAIPHIFWTKNGGFDSFFFRSFHKVMGNSHNFGRAKFIYKDGKVSEKNMRSSHNFMEGIQFFSTKVRTPEVG